VNASIVRAALALAAIGALGLSAAGPAAAQAPGSERFKTPPRTVPLSVEPHVAAAAIAPANPTPLQNVTVNLTVAIPGASTARFDPTYDPIVEHQVCYFVRNWNYPVADAPMVNGQAVLLLRGQFYSSESTTSCGLFVRVNAVYPGGRQQSFVLKAPVTVRAWTRYTFTDTAQLTGRLAFHTTNALGLCEGVSVGSHAHNVGVGSLNGKLTINMRSGPIGTLCAWTSTAWRLPDGAHVVEATWDVATDGSKCCLDLTNCPNLPLGVGPDSTVVVPGHIVAGSQTDTYEYMGLSNPIVTDLAENLGPNPNRLFLRFLRPMWTRLTCGVTLDNDNGIRITLRSVTIEGPPGLTLP